ncbi:Ldh family oxidoreductase [Bacillus yapensis]|uniref:Ldh family oxidoreductase n=1 Tax=Bacillus yapensis TaxID=2492960 RepID=UPI0014851B8D|nr:Ldh family oxidoreductase [Bacillus yapensis]
METTYLLSNEEYIRVGKSALIQVGVSTEHSDIVIQSLLDSDQKGIHTHGLFRLPTYIKQISRGNINPQPIIQLIEKGSNIKLLDGDSGLGSVNSFYAMKEAIKLSSEKGIGIVGVRNSNHFGTAAYYAELASSQNKIGIVMTNASPAIAPTGGKKPVLGNNPWSISVPTHIGHPITLDMANSVARGKIRIKALNGEPIPVGWALNSKGEPTTDANEALEGLILPVGDHKGYGITLMVDILTGVLTGAYFGNQNPGIEEDGKRNNGHLFISLNPEAFMSIEEFKNRLNELINMIKSVPKINENTEIYLPGELEWKTKLSLKNDKIKLPERIFDRILSFCHEQQIQLPDYVSV